jgi:hypothetical protein
MALLVLELAVEVGKHHQLVVGKITVLHVQEKKARMDLVMEAEAALMTAVIHAVETVVQVS